MLTLKPRPPERFAGGEHGVARLLQGCAADPELLSSGDSFGQSDSYGLIVFGVNVSHRQGSHGGGAVAFGKIDLAAESLEVSCFSGATILSVSGPRKRTDTMMYWAFRAPPGVYVTSPTLHASHYAVSRIMPHDRVWRLLCLLLAMRQFGIIRVIRNDVFLGGSMLFPWSIGDGSYVGEAAFDAGFAA